MFDIHQEIWDENGEFDSSRLENYIRGLMDEFVASPEAQPVIEQYGDPSWPATMMDFAADYLGLTPAKMSVADFNEVVFHLFPRKVSTDRESAEEIVAELKAFWTFVGRQYGVDDAQEIVGTLDDRAVNRLEKELADPSNFGMAKSFFMLGEETGFDMTTQKGLDEFLSVYNSAMLANPRNALLDGMDAYGPLPFREAPSRNEREERRKKRKQQRQARKRQRR